MRISALSLVHLPTSGARLRGTFKNGPLRQHPGWSEEVTGLSSRGPASLLLSVASPSEPLGSADSGIPGLFRLFEWLGLSIVVMIEQELCDQGVVVYIVSKYGIKTTSCLLVDRKSSPVEPRFQWRIQPALSCEFSYINVISPPEAHESGTHF